MHRQRPDHQDGNGPCRRRNDLNLLDMSTKWSKSSTEGMYEGRDSTTGELEWTVTPGDSVFGSSSELRAVAEVYAAAEGQEKFVRAFVNEGVDEGADPRPF